MTSLENKMKEECKENENEKTKQGKRKEKYNSMILLTTKWILKSSSLRIKKARVK
jgi:phage host-nuclease inhibitor protein Gam